MFRSDPVFFSHSVINRARRRELRCNNREEEAEIYQDCGTETLEPMM